MKSTGKAYLLCALVFASVLIIGALAFGASLSTLLAFGIILACPLMMIFMMSSMGGHGGGSHGGHTSPHQNPQDESHR